MAVHQGPGFPDRRHHPGPTAAFTTPTHTGRGRIIVRAKTEIEPMQQQPSAHRRDGNPLHGQQGQAGGEDRRAGARQAAGGHLRHPRRERPRAVCASSSSSSGTSIRQVVLNYLYKHTQMQETFGAIMLALVDGEPQDADPAADALPLPRAPEGRRRSAARATTWTRPRRAPTSWKACSSRWTTSTRLSASSAAARTPAQAKTQLDGALRPLATSRRRPFWTCVWRA